jgi:hypothetical protein
MLSISRLARAASGSIPLTVVHPSDASQGARGMRVASASVGSPMKIHTKLSCSTTG